ncbi:MAG: 3-hydroxyacyl-CoA dehydrogenase NAD-binding domain-containing protein [Trueperaceae bacterium]
MIGSGTMGSGIAQACAAAGHRVVLFDINEAALERAASSIRDSLERLVRKERLTRAQADESWERIVRSRSMTDLADADVVIEAVFEDLEVKRSAWQQAAEAVPATSLLATNTSSLSITEIAGFSGSPERFCGMHFFNPVALMPLVEVVQALNSTSDTIERAREFVEGLGKTAIICQDKPGFIVNRLLIPYLNDAVHALSEGVASAEDIDRAMTLGANMPIGPLALADLVGLDVSLAAAESLHREFGDSKFRVAPLLRQMVRAGKLGRKSGRGFFSYD